MEPRRFFAPLFFLLSTATKHPHLSHNAGGISRISHPHRLFFAGFVVALLVILLCFGAASASSPAYAYIANYGSITGGGNTVSVIDTSNHTVVNTITVADDPYGIGVTPDGSKVYVSGFGSYAVSVIDTSTSVVSTIPAPRVEWGVAISPDGSKAYVTETADLNIPDNVSVIDTSSNSIVDTIGVGISPLGIAVTPDGSKVYVANAGIYPNPSTVSVIDTSTDTVTDTINVGVDPAGVAVSPDGSKVYVANYISSSVSVINTATNTVVNTISVGSNPYGVAVSPDGSRLYVAISGGDVAVINTSTNSLITNVVVGSNPKGISVTPDGSEVYVSNSQSGTVSVIDTATNLKVTDITVGSNPVSIGQFISPGYTHVSVPTVTSISPSSGSTSGGTSVTITGTNFTGTTAVRFGSTSATSFVVNSNTRITAASPAGSAGTVDVTVTKSGVTSSTSSADRFTYATPAGADAMFRYDSARTANYTPVAGTIGTSVSQIYNVTVPAATWIPASPSMADGILYLPGGDNALRAVWTINGTTLWTYTAAAQVRSTPAVSGGLVFFGDYINFTAVDAATGAIVWQNRTGGTITSSPVVANGIVYVGSDDGYVYAFTAATGAPVWSYQTGDFVAGGPAVANGVLYAISFDGYVYALDAATGTFLGKGALPAGRTASTTPAVSGGMVFVTDTDSLLTTGDIVAFRTSDFIPATTAMPAWTNVSATPVYSCPAVANGTVYVGTGGSGNNIWAFDAATGATKWQFALDGGVGHGGPVTANGIVFAGSADGTLSALDGTTGHQIWTFKVFHSIDSSPVIENGVLYVIGTDMVSQNNLYALNIAGSASAPPTAAFISTPTSGTAPLLVTFTDQSDVLAGTMWNWSFGDTNWFNSTVTSNPIHTYTSAGTYDVSLTVTNVSGSNTATQAGYIHVSSGGGGSAPTAAFSGLPISGTAPLDVTFTDSSDVLTGTMWNWSFGDTTWFNNTASSSPVHSYTAPGTYDVSLTVTNASGSNTATRTGYITVTSGGSGLPTAGFSGAPTSGTAPLAVTFTDSSDVVAGTMWNWSFGDSTWFNNTASSSPVHSYSSPGTYDVSLTVTNTSGSNTAIQAGYIHVTSSGGSGVMFRYDAAHSGNFTPVAGTTGTSVSELWNYTMGQSVDSSPAVANGIVYVGNDDGNVYAFDATTGAKLWNYTTGDYVYSSPAVVNGIVYVGSGDGNVYALDATTGAKLWNFNTGRFVASSPAVVNGIVYVGNDDGNVYALDATTGTQLWTFIIGSLVYSGIYSSPAVANGVVYVGSYDNKVYALDATTGTQLWNYTTGGYVYSSPAVVNGIVYVGSGDGNVYALDATTGTPNWIYTTGGDVTSSPAVANGVVYVGSLDGNVYALDATTGAQLWNFKTSMGVDSSPAVANGVVYVGNMDYNVSALDATTGAQLWNFKTMLNVDSSPAVANGVVYIGSSDFHFYALNTNTLPAVAGISPATGLTAGGTPVTIMGTGFTGATDVYFGTTDIPSASFISNTDIKIVVNSPAGVAGIVDVTVKSPAGTSTTSASDKFTYTASGSAPTAAFSGLPTSGTAPLTVAFTDSSSGSPTGWAWFFGDEKYTQPWTQQTASAGWSGRDASGSVAMPDGSIVLMGGYYGAGYMYNDTWRSTDRGATWVLMNSSSGWSERDYPSTLSMPDGSIVLIGGSGSSNYNDTWQSTDNGATWLQMTSHAPWTGRITESVVMPDGSIVIMGGQDINGNRNDTWRSIDNGATWTLQTAHAGWTERVGQSAVAMPDGSIVLMGGLDLSGRRNDTWRSTDKGVTWTQMNVSSGWSARGYQRSDAMPDGSIILMGGSSATGKNNDVWRSTDNGATWTQVNVNAGWPARSSFSSVAMPDGSIVLMTGLDSTGSYLNDTWRFQPAGSSLQNPSHTYTSPGIYHVSLTARDASGFNTLIQSNYIRVSDVLANFTWTCNATVPYRVDFHDATTTSFPPIGSLWWAFGDGATDMPDNANPMHTYASATPVRVNLSVWDSLGGGGVENDTFRMVTPCGAGPGLPTAAFSGSPISGTVPLDVTFTDSSDVVAGTMWNWSFGDTTWYNHTTSSGPTHTYTLPGTYDISLTVTNASGSNTATQAGYIHVTSGGGGSGVMFRYDAAHSGNFTPVAGTTGTSISKLWNFTTGSSVFSSPTVANGIVYVGSENDFVYAINANTGAQIWNFTTGGIVFSSPAVINGNVYVGSKDGKVYALNANTGALIWTFTTGGAVDSSPAVINGIVYVGSDDDNVYALNANTGALIWTFTTGFLVESAPAVANGIVYVGSEDDNMYALNANTGTQIWNFTTGGAVFSSPAVVNGIVYVGSWDDNIYALNANTGALIWTFTTGSAVLSSPAVINGTVYIGSEDGKVYALNANTGAQIWNFTTGNAVFSSPAVINGTVYVGSEDDYIYAFNASYGTPAWSYKTGGWVDSSPAVINGTVYVGSWDDNVYALNTNTLPAVAGISPVTGPTTGGTPVTIIGIGFTGATDVYFGTTDIPSASFVSNTGTQIVVNSPAGVAGMVDVTVKSPAGTSTTSASDKFTYTASGSSAPAAAFSGSPTSGTAPLAVTFTDSSDVLAGTMWNWSFGDTTWFNNTASSSPAHTYTAPGTYDVSLTVTNASGSNTTTRTGYIDAYPPLISATSSRGIGPVGTVFLFSGTNTYGTSPDMYTDIFMANTTDGTGPLGNGVRPDDLSVHILTGDNTTVNQSFVYPGGAWLYPWDSTAISGGSLLPGSPYTFYFANRTYNRSTLPATGPDFGWTRVQVGIEGPITAGYAKSTSAGTVPLTVVFTDISTGYPERVNLSFGDGSWSNSTGSMTHVYTGTGTFSPVIFADNSISSDTKTNGTVVVSSGGLVPYAHFTASPTSGAVPLTVQFTDTSDVISPLSWNWNFGDDSWFNTTDITSRNPMHTYNHIGLFTVSLTITNASGSNTVSYPYLISGTDRGYSGGSGGGSDDSGNPGVTGTATPAITTAVPVTVAPTGTPANDNDLVHPVVVTGVYHIGFPGLTFNADGKNTLILDLDAAHTAGAVVTSYFDRIEVYQHNSPGVLITFWGDQFNTANQTITGTASHAEFTTDPLNATFPLGTVSGSVHAALPALIQPGILTKTLTSPVNATTTSRFSDITTGSSLNMNAVAYTLTVKKENLTTGAANVTLTVPASWVNINGGKDAVYVPRIGDDGKEELLSTTCTGTGPTGTLIFRGDSPNGTSLFGLLTAEATAAKQQENPNTTYIPASKPAMVTNVGMFGWIFHTLSENPLLILVAIAVLAVVLYFGWWRRRL